MDLYFKFNSSRTWPTHTSSHFPWKQKTCSIENMELGSREMHWSNNIRCDKWIGEWIDWIKCICNQTVKHMHTRHMCKRKSMCCLYFWTDLKRKRVIHISCVKSYSKHSSLLRPRIYHVSSCSRNLNSCLVCIRTIHLNVNFVMANYIIIECISVPFPLFSSNVRKTFEKKIVRSLLSRKQTVITLKQQKNNKSILNALAQWKCKISSVQSKPLII